ncbi:uncharacterized protein LOC132715655 [Ruditapes philippinarum]|uniref:uncharacterized protein LOC132715655 n=1 Tax=Ruditapes philippinarum TaxID=129788 RepID=UPI00295B3807|nr:uncharacterized protein LOC132715655 [Ruditapes philippinarum]
MDGTHSTAPQQFGQLFCIRVPLSDSHVSVVYALLPGKQQSHYEECFTAILDVCLQKDIRPNPATIVADYEIAIHNAVRSVIGSSIHIQGCFYHLTQATWRHIQSEGFTVVIQRRQGYQTLLWSIRRPCLPSSEQGD